MKEVAECSCPSRCLAGIRRCPVFDRNLRKGERPFPGKGPPRQPDSGGSGGILLLSGGTTIPPAPAEAEERVGFG